MNNRQSAITALVALLVCASTAASARSPSHCAARGIEDASVYVVYNSSDEDAQVFLSGGSDKPLRRISVKGPRGLTHTRASFRDGGRLGQSDFQFESPEPTLDELRNAYPEGLYRFVAVTVNGFCLSSKVELSYELLPPPFIIYPSDGDVGVPIQGLTVFWEPINEAEAIRFEIEDEEEEVKLTADLPGDGTQFDVPATWLRPGVEYTLDIKAVAENGNQTVRDIRFITAE